MTVSAKLPRRVEPRFPELCVRCGGRPNSTLTISTRSIGLTSLLGWFGTKVAVAAPCCVQCRPRLRNRQHFDKAMLFITVGLGLALAFGLLPHLPWLSELGRPARRVVSIALLLPALIPYVVVAVAFPPALELTATSDEVEYEFTNRAVAQAFLEANF